MSAHDDAREAVGCPRCGVRKGARCKRLADSTGPWKWDWERGDEYRVIHQAGEPMESVHSERLAKMRDQRAAVLRAQWYRDHAAALAEAKEVHEARVALAQHARQEHAELREWLRAYGSVLVGI